MNSKSSEDSECVFAMILDDGNCATPDSLQLNEFGGRSKICVDSLAMINSQSGGGGEAQAEMHVLEFQLFLHHGRRVSDCAPYLH